MFLELYILSYIQASNGTLPDFLTTLLPCSVRSSSLRSSLKSLKSKQFVLWQQNPSHGTNEHKYMQMAVAANTEYYLLLNWCELMQYSTAICSHPFAWQVTIITLTYGTTSPRLRVTSKLTPHRPPTVTLLTPTMCPAICCSKGERSTEVYIIGTATFTLNSSVSPHNLAQSHQLGRSGL